MDVSKHITAKLKNFFRASLLADYFCKENNLDNKKRLTMYKAVVRSHWDYGMPLIHYTKTEINKLEKVQYKSIYTLLNINKNNDYNTTLTLLKSAFFIK